MAAVPAGLEPGSCSGGSSDPYFWISQIRASAIETVVS